MLPKMMINNRHTWNLKSILELQQKLKKLVKKTLNVVDLRFELIVLYYLDKFAFGKENKMVSIL